MKLHHTTIGMTIFLLLFAASVAVVSANTTKTWYAVRISTHLYQPAHPFHITDVRYQDKSNFETRTVQVLQPMQGNAPLQQRPVIFYVHGGGWTDGYADWYTDVLTPTLVQEKGWVVVNVDYRLTSNQVYLADTWCPSWDQCNLLRATKSAWYNDNIADVAAAFDWTVAHIAEYGGDPENIYLFGHSAGGHLVSLLATHEAYATRRPHMKGIISLSGLYNLNTVNPFAWPLFDQMFRGGHTDTAALTEASPQTYVNPQAALPPFLLLYCQLDLPSLPEQALAFQQALRAANQPVQTHYLPNYNHISEMIAIANPDALVTEAVIAYVEQPVGPQLYLPLLF
jgi:acetyl esterase/lipase